MDHASWFSYNLSKPYPFRWFTPVALIGGMIAIVIFSTVNLATQGYSLQTIYTTTPNETLAQEHWFTKSPWSYAGKLKPTCQAQNMPIGYQFFTSNLGLSYNLKSVTSRDVHSNQTVELPSLPYLNNTLSNCTVDNVKLLLKKTDLSENGAGAWWSWGDSSATAGVTCLVNTANGLVNASFTTAYSSDPRQYEYVISNNYTSAASMWWGSRLLNLYWSAMLNELAFNTFFDNGTDFLATPFFTKGEIDFYPNRTDDIKGYDLFQMSYYFIASDGNIQNVLGDLDSMYNNDQNNAVSAPLTEGLAWAKVMYSMMLTDLGQTHLPNLLTDENLLQWSLQYPDDKIRQELDPLSCDTCDEDWTNFGGIAPPGADTSEAAIATTQYLPMNQSYAAYKSQTGPLGTKDATIFSQYACSVPVRKDMGTLFLAILIADLVFLQALWTLLKLFADSIVIRQEQMALSRKLHGIGEEATPLDSMSRSDFDSQQKLVPARVTVHSMHGAGPVRSSYAPLN